MGEICVFWWKSRKTRNEELGYWCANCYNLIFYSIDKSWQEIGVKCHDSNDFNFTPVMTYRTTLSMSDIYIIFMFYIELNFNWNKLSDPVNLNTSVIRYLLDLQILHETQISIWCFSVNHVAIHSKNVDWLVLNENNRIYLCTRVASYKQ